MKSKSSLAYAVLLLIGGVFVVAGWCLLAFLGKPTLENAKASAAWPSTAGVVTESRIKHHRSDDGVTYSPEVVYRYQPEDQEIHGDRIWMGISYSSSNRAEHERVIADYPVGKEVIVYYKPDDPFVSVLQPGVVWSSYFGMFLGWLFFGLGMAFLGGVVLSQFVFKKKEDESFPSGGGESTDDGLLI